MRKNNYLIIGIVFFALLGVSWNAIAATELGDTAPSLTLKKLDGETFDLGSLKGKVVLVHFWATWCAPCREEMPVLDSFYSKYHEKGVELIAISTDTSRHRSDVLDVMKSYKFPAAMMSDADPNGFGMPSTIPITYVVDGKGVVRAKLSPDTSPLSGKSLSDLINPLLAH